MQSALAHRSRQQGFTLVELAIVLVIIGLLVGGVLVGQDLIKAAEIRAVASDIERYNTGAAAFRTKYNGGIPGDLLATTATSFGLPYGDGNDGEGDGDGLLENNTTTDTGMGGENLLFWTHLGAAQFIPFSSDTYTTAAGADTALAAIDTTNYATVATAQAGLLAAMPQLRIRDSGFIHAFGISGLNYYLIGSYYTAGGTSGALTASAVLTPREAQGIDRKLDDGAATEGIVIAYDGAVASATAPGGGANTPAAGDCYDDNTEPNAYANTSDPIANAIGCGLRIRAGI